jgi:hypothetical protein
VTWIGSKLQFSIANISKIEGFLKIVKIFIKQLFKIYHENILVCASQYDFIMFLEQLLIDH